LGLSPHATNTVGPKTLRWSLELAAQHGLALCTHVAESLAERALITHASGPNRAFLEELGLWTPELEGELGQGLSPIAHFAQALRVGPALNKPVRWILAHCNDASDADLDLLQGLADSGVDVTVAFCPRASAYFAASELLGPHRYRAMLDRGVNVALGTDSIINLPPIAGEEGTRLSPIWDARLLHARDGTDPRTLLAMMTTSAARALNLDEQRFTILGTQRKGPIAGLVGVDIGTGDGTASELLARVMRSARPPELLLAGKKCGTTEH